MTFRNKILFSIWGVVLSLLVITFFIINYWTRDRVENTFTNELRANFSSLQLLTRLQSETLVRSCRVIAESPRLRAVAELGDPATAYELSRELTRSTMSRLFIITDKRGAPLARLVEARESKIDVGNRPSVQAALRGESLTDVWAIQDSVYRVVSTPMLLDTEVIGTLTMGFHISGEELLTLKQATNSDIILMLDGTALLSTLDSGAVAALLPALAPAGFGPSGPDTAVEVMRIPTAGATYLGTVFPLSRRAAGEPNQMSFCVVKPFSKEVNQSMKAILGTFGLISLVFLGLTSVIGIVISRGMTSPITALVKGTNEVSRGNYDYAIQRHGNDEISYLGTKFMEMSRSLKEKIAELDGLNRDLLKRNEDLDETLQRLREAQQELVRNERLAATGKLTAQLAHEINNPIHNIQSCLQSALHRMPRESKGRELLEVAFEEVGRMSRLTRQMLDIYRSSYVEIQYEPVSLGTVVQETLGAMQEELTKGGITVQADVPADGPVIQGSRDKLKQVFLNLLLNALDAMPGGGNLRVILSMENGRADVTVSDTGTGIPAENLPRIFDAFFTTKDKASGVGLGLSVCYGIVTQHNGTISVFSEPGNGTTFVVSFPLHGRD